MKLIRLSTILLTIQFLCTALSASTKCCMPEWDAGYRGEIPSYENIISVDAQALSATSDSSASLQAIIDGALEKSVILLPEGEFLFLNPIYLKSNIVLRGEGDKKTRLNFDLTTFEEAKIIDVRPACGGIVITGKGRGEERAIVEGFEIGSTLLTIEDSKLKAGDMILVFSENDGEILYTQERWNKPWAKQSLAQVVHVKSVEGDLVEIDTGLRLNYQKELDPRVTKLNTISGVGIENIFVQRLDKAPGKALGKEFDNIIGFEQAENCWVRDIEGYNSQRGHVWMNYSRFITVRDSYFHHAHGYGSGGQGYGVVCGNVAVDCLIENNIFHTLRHAMMVKRGSNGNVFAYNYSFERTPNPKSGKKLCDISLHGHYPYQNLFEGNVIERMEYADFWGPTGPNTIAFRNRVAHEIELSDHSHKAVILGNTFARKKGFRTDGTSEDLVFKSNRMEGDLEDSDTCIPASLYLTEKPAFWGMLPWPAIGADVDVIEPYNAIPAQMRFLNMQGKYDRREGNE